MNAITSFPAISKLVPLLGSDKQGEVCAAAAAIGRSLRGAGYDWHDLSRAIEIGAAAMVRPVRKVELVEAITEIDMARFCLQFVGEHTESEADFIRSAMRLLAYERTLSPKQRRWLCAIFTALGGRA